MDTVKLIRDLFKNNYRVLILDNEVTVKDFVAEPPLSWARLILKEGSYIPDQGSPTFLTNKKADQEKLNWDHVSNKDIRNLIKLIDNGIDLIVFGNNAGQGYPLALALSKEIRANCGVVVYGNNLPEQEAYEKLGYKVFCRRVNLLHIVRQRALAVNLSPSLIFINTIQHNHQNYHAPWPSNLK